MTRRDRYCSAVASYFNKGTKKKPRWYYIEPLAKEDGKRRQRWVGPFTSRAAAEQAWAHRITGSSSSSSGLTVAEWGALWLASKTSLAPGTRDLYETCLRAYVDPHIGHLGLEEVTPAQLQRLYTLLAKKGGRNETPLKPATVSNVARRLHTVFEEAVNLDLIARNPAKRVGVSAPPPPGDYWTLDELHAFEAHSRGEWDHGDPWYPLWALYAATGLRRGEALGLRWDDFSEDAVTVNKARTAYGKNVREGDVKTSGSMRSVSLDPRTIATLKTHRKRQLEGRAAWDPEYGDYEDGGYVFALADGAPPDPRNVSRWFTRAAERAKVRRITLHQVRHTHATLLLEAGVDEVVVMQRLGHRALATTREIYGHVTRGMSRSAAEAAGRILYGG